MERELWAEVSAAISIVDQHFSDNGTFVHSTARIVRVFFWAVIHNAAVSWACHRRNGDRRMCPPELPGQSTLSRRPRTPEFRQFMEEMQRRLSPLPGATHLVKRLDAKPLPVAAHSTDRDAGGGRGAGQTAKGYKLHALWGGGAMPLQWRLAPLNVSEQEMARRMRRDLDRHDAGYVVADKGYDANHLFDLAGARGHPLISPRRCGAKRGLGHPRHSPYRLRCKDLLEAPTRRLTRFGPTLLHHRGQIERDFGHCTSFTGGLIGLPAWVRRYRRVHAWVWAKLLINAARIRLRHRRKAAIGA